MKIFKEDVNLRRTFGLAWSFRVPRDSQPLCVKLQREIPTLWYSVGQSHCLDTWKVISLPTGRERELGPEYFYLDTLLLEGGDLVAHFFINSRPVGHIEEHLL